MKNIIADQIAKEKLGIDNIQEAFSTTLKLAKEVKTLVDNWNLGNAFSLLLQLAKYQVLIPVYKQAVKEAGDLDKTEIAALQLFFKDQIEFENQKLEEVVEEGIDIIVEGYETIDNAIQLYIRIKNFVPKIKLAKKELPRIAV